MITCRPMEHDDDRDFVRSSWSTSFRTCYAAGLIDMDAWPDVMHAQIDRYLDRPNVRTVLAVEKADPMFFYGFITADTTPQVERLEYGKTRVWPALVYYCFVKADYRKVGVARRLFAAAGVDPTRPFLYACKTPMVTRLGNKAPLAKWNPLVARFNEGKDAA